MHCRELGFGVNDKWCMVHGQMGYKILYHDRPQIIAFFNNRCRLQFLTKMVVRIPVLLRSVLMWSGAPNLFVDLTKHMY